MSQKHTDIIRQIREAAAFEGTASKYDDRYEQTMKSAGASMYNAFAEALRAQPEYQGRLINEDAVRRIYVSTKPRPWWDELLLEAGYRKDGTERSRRQGAVNLVQWHIDPLRAVRARGKHIADDAARREKLSKQQRSTQTQHARACQVSKPQPRSASLAEHAKGSASPADMKALRNAASGRLHSLDDGPEIHATREDCAGEINRIKVALGRLKEGPQFDTALEMLKATAREIERL